MHLHERSDRDHLPGGVAGLQAGDVLDIVAELWLGLGDDLIGAAEAVEVIHIETAEIDLERFEKILQRDALRLRFFAIHIGLELGHVHGVSGVDLHELTASVSGADEILGGFVERGVALIATILDHHFKSPGRADAVHRRRGKDEDHGVLNLHEFPIERARNGFAGELGSSAILEVIEADENDPAVRTDAESVNGEPGESNRVFHARVIETDLGHAAHDLVRAVERGAVGKLGETDEILFVLRRNKSGWGDLEALPGRPDETAVDDKSDRAEADETFHEIHIRLRRPLKEAVEGTEEPAEEKIEEP